MTTAWPEVRLGDVVVEARPGFASGHDLDEGVFQFRMNNLTRDGHFDLSKRRRVPCDTRKIESFLLRSGDVLFNATNSPELVGKSAYIGDLDEPAVFSNHFLRIRVDTHRVAPRFLWRWLQLQWQRGLFRSRARQWVNQAAFGREALVELQIPLPPIDEQRRIAAVLDRADELRAKCQTSLAMIDSLNESIFRDMFGDPFHRRYSWTGRLSDAATFVGGGTPSRSVSAYYTGSICWATSKDMKSRYLHDTQEHITDEAVASSATRLVPAGSVLVVVKSKVLAHSLPVAETLVPSCFGQDLKAVIPRPGWSASFLASSLRVGSRWLLERARGVNTEGLTLDHLRAFPIPDVPSSRQAVFDQNKATVAAIAKKCHDEMSNLDELFASLQHRAFAGQL